MTRILAAVFALALVVGSASAEEVVVIESTLAAFTPGAAINGDQVLKLPEKSKLVLVTEGGRTVILTGPYEGKPAPGGSKAADSRLTTALASLVRSTQEDANSVGAIRAAGIKTRGDALRVNLSESGDYCIGDPGGVEMTRNAIDKGDEITLNAVKGDLKASFSWPAGSDHTTWPAAMAPEDGATYLVGQSGKDSRTMLIIHRVQDDAPTDAHRAVFMAEKGCLEQAKMLLALIRRG